jgi:hypothetical protein
METIEAYLQNMELPHSYEIGGEEKSLEEFDGIAYSLETGDEIFLEWNLSQEDDYQVTLSEDTPGMVREIRLEELKTKLQTQEYTPVKRTETEYLKADVL